MSRGARLRGVAVLALAGCRSEATLAPPASACGGSDALVALSDYASSGVGVVSIDGAAPVVSFGADLGKDPSLAVSRGRAFYLARLEATVFEVDPSCGRPLRKFDVSDPARKVGANPWDVAAAPDGALWIPRYALADLAIVTPSGTARIDLSPYDDDGNPQASAIRIVDTAAGAKAFVALERLDDGHQLRSSRPSQMLRIDVATRAVEAVVELAGRNPFNAMAEDGGALYLAMPGNFSDAREADAGVERFDLGTSTTRLLVRETDLGGSVAEVAVHGRCGAVIVADADPILNRTSLATFDAASGAVLAKNILGPSESFEKGLRGLAWVSDGAVLLVGDRNPQGDGLYAVHAFRRDDACALHALPDGIFVHQKPISVRAPQ